MNDHNTIEAKLAHITALLEAIAGQLSPNQRTAQQQVQQPYGHNTQGLFDAIDANGHMPNDFGGPTSSDVHTIRRRALAYQAEQRALGRDIDYVQAVCALSKGDQ